MKQNHSQTNHKNNVKMKKTTIIIITIIALSLPGLVGCGGEETPVSSTSAVSDQQARQKMLQEQEAQRIADSTKNAVAAQERAKKDSLVNHINFEEATAQQGRWHNDLPSEIDYDGIIPLHVIYNYGQADLLHFGGCEIYLSQVIDQVIKFAGFERKSMATWEKSMDKMIAKFSVSLSSGRKKMVAQSFEENAKLIEQLNNLSDDDQTKLMQMIDTIVSQQTADSRWITSSEGSELLKQEYELLAKVWQMPKLKEGKTTYSSGPVYYLGNPVNDESYDYEGRLWNSRYLNRFQFAIGFFHRRCLDVSAVNPSARREVSKNVARLMQKAAKTLREN